MHKYRCGGNRSPFGIFYEIIQRIKSTVIYIVEHRFGKIVKKLQRNMKGAYGVCQFRNHGIIFRIGDQTLNPAIHSVCQHLFFQTANRLIFCLPVVDIIINHTHKPVTGFCRKKPPVFPKPCRNQNVRMLLNLLENNTIDDIRYLFIHVGI